MRLSKPTRLSTRRRIQVTKSQWAKEALDEQVREMCRLVAHSAISRNSAINKIPLRRIETKLKKLMGQRDQTPDQVFAHERPVLLLH